MVMVTLCWAAKGGSGTTVVTAALALGLRRHSLLVDLDGDLPAVLGLAESDRPGIDDWLRSAAPADHLGELVVDVDASTSLLTRRRSLDEHARGPTDEGRWGEFALWLRRQHDDGIEVFVDGGTATPHDAMVAVADQVLLVTRPCYLSLRRATRSTVRPTGVILIEEPGASIKSRAVERCLGAPVVAKVSVDPAIARAVNSGLLAARLPWAIGRELRGVAA
jgi:MinD superfamily P-loop ATPase